MLTIRVSSLPLLFRCAAAAQAPDLRIAEGSEPADLGSAAHEALRPVAEGLGVAWDAIPEIAGRWGVDDGDVRALAAMGAKLWPLIRDTFPDATTEHEVAADVTPTLRIVGHLDFASRVLTFARAGDWKTGRVDSDYREQMRGYAALLLLEDPKLTEATVTIVWLRDGDIENYTLAREGLAAWIADVTKIAESTGSYSPGAHCDRCPRAHECPARTALARRDVAAFAGSDEAALTTMTASQIVDLYRHAKRVFLLAERAKDAIRAHVEATGDVAVDGARLTLVDEERRGLSTLAAWPVLEGEGLTDEETAEVVDIRLSKLEALVASKAGRGKGAAAVRDLGKKLAAVDAVRVRTVRKLTERRG